VSWWRKLLVGLPEELALALRGAIERELAAGAGGPAARYLVEQFSSPQPEPGAGGWPSLRRLIEQGRLKDVAATVRSLPDSERRAVAKELTAYAKPLLGPRGEGWDLPWELRALRLQALRVAAVGCQTGAEAATRWLARSDLIDWGGRSNPAILDVLGGRDPEWLADVATRLAARLSTRRRNDGLWHLTRELVLRAGAPPPTTDAFVVGWVETLTWHRGTLVDGLAGDPFLDALLPKLFEVDEVGGVLIRPAGRGRQTWPEALGELVARGRIDRGAVLDGCLGRLLRGGPAARLRGYVQLHDNLDPDVDELAARARDYAALLADSPPVVAKLAQAALRRLDGAGRLDLERLVDATGAVLFRPERSLLRAQLAWVDAAARKRREQPADLGRLLLAATGALTADAADVRERASALIRRHEGHADAAARAELIAATSGSRAAAGDEPTPAPVAVGVGVGVGGAGPGAAAAAPPAAFPPPIGTPVELAEELAALARPAPIDPVAFERVLAALVRFAHADRAALADALSPVVPRLGLASGPGDLYLGPASRRRAPDGGEWDWMWVTQALLVAVAAVVAPGGWKRWWSPRDQVLRQPTRPGRRGPQIVLVWRLGEVILGLLHHPVPALVATPTATPGWVDPAVLVARLAEAEDGGWQPWPCDLWQAMLRLPRAAGPEAAGLAGRLRSPAGRLLAARLAGGPFPDPTVTRVTHVGGRSWNGDRRSEAARTRVLAAIAPAPAPAGPPAPGDGLALVNALFDLPAPAMSPPGPYTLHDRPLACWPAVAPSHRDVIAAHLLRELSSAYPAEGAVEALPLLAEVDGPVGPGLAAALVKGLGDRDLAGRAAAAEALAILDRRGQLDATAVGLEAGEVLGTGLIPVNRVAAALRDLVPSGHADAVLAILAAALPTLLKPAGGRARAGLADLVAVCAEALAGATAPARAAADHAGGLAAAVAWVAGRGGTSRLAAESRRLRDLLAAP